MTESSHEGEALNAIRKANAMLAQENANWDDVLNGRVVFQKEKSKSKKDVKKFTDQDEIEGYFTILHEKHLGSFQEFVDSVYEFWFVNRYLTERQYEVIKNAADRHSPMWRDI